MRRTDAGRYIKKNAHGMKESADNGSASKIDTRFLPSRLYELPKFPSMAAAPDNKRPAKRTRGPRFIMLSLFKSFRFSYIGGRRKSQYTAKSFPSALMGRPITDFGKHHRARVLQSIFSSSRVIPKSPPTFFLVTFIYDGIKSRVGKSFLVLIYGRIVLVELYLLLIMSAYTRTLQSRRSKMNFRPRYSRYPQLICYKLTPARLQK